LGDKAGDCSCSADRVARYRGKISGPLLDRIDLQIEVGRPPKEVLRAGAEPGESSADVAQRVLRAREIQAQRNGVCNARLEARMTERYCALTPGGLALLEEAVDQFKLSARAYQRVLRVSRTIADLEGTSDIAPPHIAEALSLRTLDKRTRL
ncbi:MAG: ATP-binding protein, partial [Gammaproteobacteria bacterium]|nr:ATP-binding protein [Gammaproteobacteria bacterium]